MSEVVCPEQWIQEELQTADLGDERLNRRMALVLEELSQHPQASPHAACSGYKEWMGAHRFFDNPKITQEQVLAPHREATLQRLGEQERVLVIQDTTELDYSGRQPIAGAGPLQGEHRQGFFLHPLVAVTEERLCLGSVWAKIYTRSEPQGLRDTHKQRPFEAKESVRWREGYQQACALAGQLAHTQVICVQDAEADIYEVLWAVEQAAATAQGRRAEYLVRAAQNRRTDSPEGKLWAEVSASPVLGQVSFNLPRRGDQPARQVTLQVQAKAVKLQAPYRPKERQMPALQVWAVLAREAQPPQGVEPVEWLLLSSLPVEDFEAAVQALKWYTCRWEIEIFFKVFKTGCQVEKLQLKEGERLRPALALYLIIAWRILYLTMLGRVVPELSCAAVLAECEWKAVWVVSKKSPVPAQPPSLAEMIRLIAMLGGYKGRKTEGPPGPKAMWEGLRRVFDLALGWNSFGPGVNHAYG